MTLSEALLPRLADWRPDGRQTLSAAGGGWSADVTAECADVVGARLWEVAVRPAEPRPVADLKARAEEVAGRVTGLLEPLRLVEVDASRQTAQLRSKEPARRGDDALYYELLLRGDGSATLHRYQANRQTPGRAETPFALTHDALGKLVDDLTA